jgi:transcriptional regulator with XRE-family HTH domain
VSTTILGKNLPIVGSYHSSLLAVNSRNAEKLGEYVKRVRAEKGLSTTEVESASRKGSAKGISDAYVTRIENGYVTNVSPEKLHALAKGLGVSEDEVFAVARGESAKPRKPLIDVDLPPEVAADLELMAMMFIEIPRECQLDSLASLAGVHARRNVSMKIHERHEARAQTRATLDGERAEQATGQDTQKDIVGPVRVATPLDEWEGERRIPNKREQEPNMPAKKQA